MGSPAGASTNNPGAPASVYTPTAQGPFDQLYQSIIGGLSPSALDPSQTPGGQNYGIGQQQVYGNVLNNPGAASLNAFSQLAPSGALDAYNSVTPNIGGVSEDIYGALGNIANNPFFAQALGGAQQGAGIGSNAATQIAGQIPGYLAQIPTLQGAAGQILQTGFDPQQALYDRTLNQVSQQSAAANANSGVMGTPYGQSVADQNLSNFNINWQNNQLGREATAGSAASGLENTALGLGQGALGLGQGATSLAAGAQALPSQTWLNQGNAVLGGVQNANSALGGLQSNYGAALQNLLGGGGANYNFYQNQGNNTLSALGGLTNLGNSQYQLPQQVLQDLQSYLGLGQSASTISGQLGNLGQQQLASSLSGVGGLLGSGLGIGSPSNPGYLGSALGLGSSAAAPTAASLGLSDATLASMAAAPTVDGGSLVASALPFAGS